MKRYLTKAEIEQVLKLLNDNYIPDGSEFDDALDAFFDETEADNDLHFVSEGYKQMLAVIDRGIATMERQVKVEKSCQMGCAHCCYYPVIMSRFEAKLLLEQVRRLPVERRTALTNHLDRYYALYGEQLDEVVPLLPSETDVAYKTRYSQANIPCPFLHPETNSCQIYELRPFPCRTYTNYADPAVCIDNPFPEETFSYEFFYGQYIDSLYEITEAVVNQGGHLPGVDYGNDAETYGHLSTFVRELKK